MTEQVLPFLRNVLTRDYNWNKSEACFLAEILGEFSALPTFWHWLIKNKQITGDKPLIYSTFVPLAQRYIQKLLKHNLGLLPDVMKFRKVQEVVNKFLLFNPLPPINIKLVVFDMDLTLLSVHTKGCYRGDIAELAKKFVPIAAKMIPILLEGYKVGVATFSDSDMLRSPNCTNAIAGEDLVRQLLLQVFYNTNVLEPEQLVSAIKVVAAYPLIRNKTPEFQAPNKAMPNNKNWHLKKLAFENHVQLNEVLFFDDSKENVEASTELSVRGYHVEGEDGLTPQMWNQAIQNLLFFDPQIIPTVIFNFEQELKKGFEKS